MGLYFSGVYDVRPVIQTESPWMSKGWLSNIEAYGEMLRRNGTEWPSNHKLVEICRGLGDEPILDIGGGFGDNYYLLRSALVGKSYHIVDNQASIDVGDRFWCGVVDKPIFHSAIPDLRFGLAICIGVLMFMDNWKGFIRGLCGRVNRVFISRSVFAREKGTFYTIIDVNPSYGQYAFQSAGECAVAVINIGELEAVFRGCGFRLEYKEHKQDYSPQMALLPEGYNKADYYDLCFERVKWLGY